MITMILTRKVMQELHSKMGFVAADRYIREQIAMMHAAAASYGFVFTEIKDAATGDIAWVFNL